MNMTSIKQAFVHCVIKNATNASDRASRSEFWWFFLFAVIMGGACYASATMVPPCTLQLHKNCTKNHQID